MTEEHCDINDHDWTPEPFPIKCRKCGMIGKISGFTDGKTLPPQKDQSMSVQVYESPYPRRKND